MTYTNLWCFEIRFPACREVSFTKSQQFSRTPAGYPTIRFNSDTIYLEITLEKGRLRTQLCKSAPISPTSIVNEMGKTFSIPVETKWHHAWGCSHWRFGETEMDLKYFLKQERQINWQIIRDKPSSLGCLRCWPIGLLVVKGMMGLLFCCCCCCC